MRFEPIAIIGRSAVLPGALHPDALTRAVLEGRDLLSSVPEGRWRLAPRHAMGPDADDHTWTDRGGYVRGFEARFAQTLATDPFVVPSERLLGLDPLFQTVLHAGREALRDAGHHGVNDRVGVVFGNLSYPSAEMSAYAEAVWRGTARPDALNRFMSGMPAHLLASVLGLGSGAFTLDAACASSLYAIELACRALHDRRADLMLAGAVCRSDDLFLHMGFCALSAMSRTGQSRPFHAHADGLVPAEGTAFVTLKRHDDAVRAGDRILGVIRGIGLSNDGRGRGLLAPSAEGQERAMRAAWEMAGLDPATVSLLECHATGTPVGDATELQSAASVFRDADGLPIGSLKSNLGHLITAAGTAGLLKVLGAMEHGLRPPTLHVDEPTPALAGTPFRLLTTAEPWTVDGPRRAGVSAFGFGGNNAHLIVEEPGAVPQATTPLRVKAEPIAVVAVGALVGGGRDAAEFAHDVLTGVSRVRHREDGTPAAPAGPIDVPLTGLRFPPRDLEQSRAQQVLLLQAAREAMAGAPTLPRDRTMVVVGMGADAEVCRYGLRWRLADTVSSDELASARDGVVPLLEAPGVVGNMPNIPANRLNSQFDLAGPSLTVSAEELSGLTALAVATRALTHHEVDAALVGAVDLSCEPVHEAALSEVGAPRVPGDAAVSLVLMRLSDARAAGADVLALVEDADASAPVLGDGGLDLTSRFGHAHAATGLVHVAAAVIACATGEVPAGSGWSQTALTSLTVSTRSLTGLTAHVGVRAMSRAPGLPPRPIATGPVLTLPSHPPPVRLPATPKPREALVSSMPAPPPLPPTSYDAPHVPAAAAPPPPRPTRSAPQTPVRTPEPAPRPTPPASPPASLPAARLAPPAPRPAPPVAAPVSIASGPVSAALAATHAALTQAHNEFVARQHAVHTAFLAMQAEQLQVLARMRQGGAAPGTLPVPSATTPSAPTPARRVEPTSAPEPRSPAHAPSPPPTPAAPAPPPASHHTKTPAASAPTPPRPSARPATRPEPRSRPAPTDPSLLPGPKFDRADLEHLASHRISERFGPMFAVQDDFPRQVRMPEPPLLLADRVTGIDAEPGSMTTGTLWSETDVTQDAWYLHQGHMPAGIMIESGQADLLLISWLGADFENKGERVYRLLGCELTYKGGLPAVGDTLSYDIHVDGHAKQGAQRLFFFHYDCRVDGEVRLAVREGQAGFFSEAELAASGGILWTPETGEHDPSARLDPPAVACTRTSFSREQVAAFALGDTAACFGAGFEIARTHTRTPRIQEGRMTFLHEVTHLEPQGGPWRRGYLRAEQHLAPDDWFFQGHFKDDPCMPGTLMFEGCLQAMAFYLAGLGYTLPRDGWRFEPVPDLPYALRCRGQCIPGDELLVYEVFVEEVIAGPEPTVFADLLCTVDGLKAFHARRVGLRLVPGWPLDEGHPMLEGYVEPKPVARMQDGFPFDKRSLVACAWGRPSEAFGAPYQVFDGVRKVARLPGPPYLFLSRVLSVSEPFGGFKPGVNVVVEYDIPKDGWYFQDNPYPTMPFCVLLEAALQPCGWLASYVGSALTTDKELFFRNLDGTATWHRELTPHDDVLRTEVTITSISASGGMIIEGFDVTCFVGDEVVYEMKTVFGFFPAAALANQLGVPPTDAERAALHAPCDVTVDLRARPARYFTGPLRLPEPMLLMCDRITGWWPEGGAMGLGRVRGEKDVNPAEWFFASHFFQDPVQPGSLGLENLVQVLQWVAIERGLADGMAHPHFEPLRLGHETVWKYRGQVVPRNKVIRTELDVVEQGEDERGRYLVADGWLWADDLRIYGVTRLAIRVVDGPPANTLGPLPTRTDADLGRSYRPGWRTSPVRDVLDPKAEPWLADHCPTWTVPALPLTVMVDRMVASRGLTLREGSRLTLRDVAVHRWLPLPGPVRVREVVDGEGVSFEAWREATKADLSRFEAVASARVTLEAGEPPTALPACIGEVMPDPYASGLLFHGPAFQLLRRWTLGDRAASAELDARADSVPSGAIHPGLLDAATHAIPHAELSRWDPALGTDVVAYPYRMPRLDLYGPAPTGLVRCEVRYLGPDATSRFVAFHLQVIDGDRVWADGELVEVLVPKGPIGQASPTDRVAFLRDRAFVPGVGLSTAEAEATVLSQAAITASDWLPGTVAAAYALRPGEVRPQVAVKDHVARLAHVHPSRVVPEPGGARVTTSPLIRWPVEVVDGVPTRVRSTGPAALDIEPVRAWWDGVFGMGRWPVEDLFYGMIERFVAEVRVEDPDAWQAVHGRSLLYLGNHQVGIESLLFSILASALGGVPTVTLAKMEHQTSWLGRLIADSFAYPGVTDPEVITFFDRQDKASLPRILASLSERMRSPGRSVMVHVEGTRSLECRTPVRKMSSAFLDMALATGAPIVPVRFTGGLPTATLDARIEFPVGLGRQTIWLGRPLHPSTLAELPYKDRKQVVIDAINALGPPQDDEEPAAPDPALQAATSRWQADHPGVSPDDAVLAAMLLERSALAEETVRVLEAMSSGQLAFEDTPKGRWLTRLARRLGGAEA